MNDKTTPRPWEGTCVSFFGKRGSLDDDALAQEAVNSYEANQQTIRELQKAVELLFDGHFPDLCGHPCEHIDCKEAHKAREFAESAMAKSNAGRLKGGI